MKFYSPKIKKCPKIFFVFGWGSAPDPLGELRRSPDLLVDWGGGEYPREYPLPILLFPQRIRRLDVRSSFLNAITWQQQTENDSLIQKFCSFVGNCSRTRRRTTRIRWTIDTHGRKSSKHQHQNYSRHCQQSVNNLHTQRANSAMQVSSVCTCAYTGLFPTTSMQDKFRLQI